MVSRLRLASGLVLFAYVATHLANHALGLVSLQVLETARGWFVAMWRSPPATAALYGALGLHLGLALWAVYRRRRLLAVDWRALQLLLGLLVPPFLVLHVLGTRFAHQFLGVNDSYTYILLIYFKFSPLDGVKQAIVLVAAWFHGYMGLHYQLRAASWYARAAPAALAAAALVPILSLLGVVAAGREVLRLAADAAWLRTARAAIHFADQAGVALIYRLEAGILLGLAALLVLVLLARRVRG